MYSAYNAPTQPSMSYTTTSLTTPIKGIIPKLQRCDETQGIPIPGRAQSHDDIRMIGSGCSSPGSNYGISPMSPRTQYIYGSSPSGMNNNSPPISCYGSPHLNIGNAVARRALSRATSPLSSSVPTTSINQYYKPSSSHSRSQAVNNSNCSRSEFNLKQTHKTKTKQIIIIIRHQLYTVSSNLYKRNLFCWLKLWFCSFLILYFGSTSFLPFENIKQLTSNSTFYFHFSSFSICLWLPAYFK